VRVQLNRPKGLSCQATRQVVPVLFMGSGVQDQQPRSIGGIISNTFCMHKGG
jgi:hypothetical protein